MTILLSISIQPPLDTLFRAEVLRTFKPRSTKMLAVIRELCGDSQAAHAQVLKDDGMSPFVHVFVNGRLVAGDSVGDMTLRDGDDLCLLTAIRGG